MRCADLWRAAASHLADKGVVASCGLKYVLSQGEQDDVGSVRFLTALRCDKALD